jgi:mycobactin peptide synthetase MbtE
MIFQKALHEALQCYSDAIAIDNGHRSTTYQQLLDKANAITLSLQQEGIPELSNIGIDITDREKMITAIIGIANARMVFVPLNPELPVMRRKSLLLETGLSAVIVDENKTEADILVLQYDELIETKGQLQLPVFQENDDLYIYFTSGSTGKPKGIIGRNKSLLQFLLWEKEAFSINETCRVSQLISPYFDAFLRDVFLPLLSGGAICIPPQGKDVFTAATLANWIQQSRVSLIHCVPSVFLVISEGAVGGTAFPDLQYILLSGEKINPAQLKPWYAAMGNRIQLVNLYGATETTMIRAFYLIQPEDAASARIPIGQPIADTRFFILQKNNKPAAPYMPGELYIATPYLTNGYLDNPELNAEKFVPLFPGTPDACMAFRTGDQARQIEGGKYELLGREDRQVKIRGIRVELDEIENTMLQSGLVTQAIVLQQQQPSANPANGVAEEVLAAFVVIADPVEEDWQERLQKYISGHLPEYMLPAITHPVEAFPLLPNGKVNYKALLALQTIKVIVAPENDIEEKLLQIWKEILGEKEISTEERFQQAGGNSLSIMRLIAKIYKEYGVRVTLNDLFNNLTIRKQAALIARSAADASLQIRPAPVKEGYVLSAAQERIYYHYQLDKESTAFNTPMAWTIDPVVDIDRLKKALQALVNRHESLRTHFEVKDNRIQQVVHADCTLEVEEIMLDEGEGVEAFIYPFELHKAPLMRCMILSEPSGRKILFTDIHHIVSDGMSQVNLFSDLMRFYHGAEPAPLPLQYKDYAEWEQQFRQSKSYISHREFWLQCFDDEVPRLALPVKAASDTGALGSNHFFTIDRSLMAPLLRRWRQDEVTDFAGFMALYFVFLSQLTGQDDIVVGINTSGRLQDELEGIVGMFAKTLPIRFRIPLEERFTQFTRQLHQFLIQAANRQVYDYMDIVNELNNNRTTKLDSLYSASLVYQNFEHRDMSDAKALFTDVRFDHPVGKYPIILFVHEEADRFQVRMQYLLSSFTPEDAAFIAGQFVQLIETIAANDEATITDCMNIEEAPVPVGNAITFNF